MQRSIQCLVIVPGMEGRYHLHSPCRGARTQRYTGVKAPLSFLVCNLEQKMWTSNGFLYIQVFQFLSFSFVYAQKLHTSYVLLVCGRKSILTTLSFYPIMSQPGLSEHKSQSIQLFQPSLGLFCAFVEHPFHVCASLIRFRELQSLLVKNTMFGAEPTGSFPISGWVGR